MVLRLSSDAPDFAEAYASLIRVRGARLDGAEEAVRPILADVRARGVAAILDYAKRFDGVDLKEDDLRVSAAEIDEAVAACAPDVLRALESAAERIALFHERLRPRDETFIDAQGVTLGWRWTPVDAAGLYAPGGRAAYPSAVLMNAVPARVAGVSRLAMMTPPGRLLDNPAILAAARIAGVTEVWRVGGAQAIAALAFGAGPIAACDVVVGPGNAYVAAAKKLVFGDVGVDSIAGPSEVFIVADGSVDPRWIAADLLAQAEHDPDAQSVLFTADAAFADAVAAAVEDDLSAGRAGASARASWDGFGAIVLLSHTNEAAVLIDMAAPEHVQLALADPAPLAAKIRHAGALFLGAHAPEALGDYVAGPNHVLPTGRRARFASGLSTLTFMKRTTIIGASLGGVRAIGDAAARLADAEGLPAHARSVRLRLGDD
ncbi:MAG: histidinol dehydrogenase [Alphaproteobacteria bacterium]|nr:histidinol dehydrogenase [Alphaproteobacteria bacterium]